VRKELSRFSGATLAAEGEAYVFLSHQVWGVPDWKGGKAAMMGIDRVFAAARSFSRTLPRRQMHAKAGDDRGLDVSRRR
jgi:hypothetical protein